jgi:transposase InsO family protein
MRPSNVLQVQNSPFLISTRWWPSSRQSRLRKVAQLLNLSKTARMRLEWFLWREARQATITTTCRHFGVTPKTYHKWAKRFNEANLRTLEDISKAPRVRRYKEYTPLQFERVVGLRKEFIRYGKEKLLDRYHTRYPEDTILSAWNIQCIIQSSGIYYHPAKHARTQAKRKAAEKKKRITELRVRQRTGFLFCLDTMVRYAYGTKRYIFTAIDRYAKLAFARMYTSKSSKNAAEFLRRLHALTAGKIENVGHDNGSEFQGEFAKACQQLNIPQYHSRTHTPKDNAVNERFNRTLQEEFVQLGHMTADTARFNQNLTEWLIEYNFYRPHASLGYVSPINLIYRHHHLLPMTPSDTYH